MFKMVWSPCTQSLFSQGHYDDLENEKCSVTYLFLNCKGPNYKKEIQLEKV